VEGASPTLSVGLPVHNGERFLAGTLDALLAQSIGDFELVLADNASTDGTEEICRDYATRDRRIVYRRSSENRGAAWNFNRAFALASGDLFKWSAADDLCEPTFLAECVSALDAAPDAVLAYPKSRLIDEDGAPIRNHEDGLELRDGTPHARLRRLVPALGYTHPVYGVIRSNALRRTRLLGTYPSADYVLLAELALLGGFVEVPSRLFVRRIHPGMSRLVNPAAAAAAEWFQPQSRPGRYRAEFSRLCFEHVVSICRAPVAPLERARCLLAFAHVGGRRYAHHLARELRGLVIGR
jgi:glycosyltransferase involved in cell wall biosynthesis